MTDAPPAVVPRPYIPRGRPVRNAVVALLCSAIVLGVVATSGLIAPRLTSEPNSFVGTTPPQGLSVETTVRNDGWLGADVVGVRVPDHAGAAAPFRMRLSAPGAVHIGAGQRGVIRMKVSCDQRIDGDTEYDANPVARLVIRTPVGVRHEVALHVDLQSVASDCLRRPA